MSEMTAKDIRNSSIGDSLFSNEALAAVGLCVDDETWRFLKVFVEATPLIRLRSLVREYRVPDSDSIDDYLGKPLPDICLVDFDTSRHSAAAVAERLHALAPGVAIFAVSSRVEPNAILEAMRSGCTEYLVKPIDREQLVNAVARVGARRKDNEKDNKKGQSKAQVLGFLGAKGGCGVTTLVTQLGALLANSYSKKTMVIDLHPDFGDAALYLRLAQPKYHFFELVENTDRLDADLLQSFLMHHSSGLALIPAPEGSDSLRDPLPGALSQTLEFLRQRYEFILVDLPVGLNDTNIEVISSCDQVYLVTIAEVSAVRNVVRQLEYFIRKEIPRDKFQIVLNRWHKRNVVSDAQIEKVIEQKIFWRVPNQYPQVIKTIHEGDPVSQLSHSEVARSLNEWAAVIGKKAAVENKKKESGGLLGLWNR
jgi:pilus assembly protein CpaE